jgi:hypothetical protein
MLNIIVVWTKKIESQILHTWDVEVVAFNDAMVEHIDAQH